MTRRKTAMRQVGVDGIYPDRRQKCITVVSNLGIGEPLWFGAERKKETLDEYFAKQLNRFQRCTVHSACGDMLLPFMKNITEWLPNCPIAYDKFRIFMHVSAVVNVARRQEFFRKGGQVVPN